MKKKYYNEKLKKCAMNAAVPDVLEKIKQADFLAYRTNDFDIIPQPLAVQDRPFIKKKIVIWTSSILAAAFVFIFAFVLLPQFTKFNNNLYAKVTLNLSIDTNINTNYSIEINSNSRIIDISADNQTGWEVLQKLSYKQKNFGSVLSELLKTFVDNWDLTEEELNNVTFSVECHDNKVKMKLENSCRNSMTDAKKHCRDKHGHNSGHSQQIIY